MKLFVRNQLFFCCYSISHVSSSNVVSACSSSLTSSFLFDRSSPLSVCLFMLCLIFDLHANVCVCVAWSISTLKETWKTEWERKCYNLVWRRKNMFACLPVDVWSIRCCCCCCYIIFRNDKIFFCLSYLQNRLFNRKQKESRIVIWVEAWWGGAWERERGRKTHQKEQWSLLLSSFIFFPYAHSITVISLLHWPWHILDVESNFTSWLSLLSLLRIWNIIRCS